MICGVHAVNDEIAEISWNLYTRELVDIVFFEKNLRFKCRRCAVFCCKLGGPRVTENDQKRLRAAGFEPMEVLVHQSANQTGQWNVSELVLKQKEDGSCIFLQHDVEGKVHRCSIYDLRPSLCRLYPFEFQKTGQGTGLLRLIPCCNGLNTREGSLVERGFIEKHLLGAIMDLLQD